MVILQCTSIDGCDIDDSLGEEEFTIGSDKLNFISINADSQAQLQNSFVLTAVPFGIPDYLPIGFLGLVVRMERLKKWKNKKKKSAKKDEELKEETQAGQGL